LIGKGDCAFEVRDTLVSGAQFIHVGQMRSGTLTADAKLQAEIDVERREKIRRNHSATHLLHAALRQVLGAHVQQKGSLVNDEKLRFDFSHAQPMSAAEIERVEDIVNEQIRDNTVVATQMMSYDDAIEHGAMALFGEKYGDEVRVLTMGDGFSVELCGGTHVERTGDIGLLKVTTEAGIASGVRRIEAATGAGAMALVRQADQQLQKLSALLKTAPASVLERVEALQQDNRLLSKQVAELTQKMAADTGADLAQSAVEVSGSRFLAAKTDGDAKSMMQTLDNLRSKLGRCVIVLASQQGDKLNLVVSVSKELTDQISAPELLNAIGPIVGIKGGGRPDMARAGGVGDARHLDAGFSAALELVEQRLS
jgi:alanyl-tRNA synthetase